MSCAITAHEAKRLPEYFNIVKRAYENLPSVLLPKTRTDTKYMYEFIERFDSAPMDSSIYVATKLRGGTVQKLHITESAYIKDRQELAAGTKQAVPLTGSISEETTGNGYNDFYDEFMADLGKKEIGEFDYKPFFYPWYIDPTYTLPGELNDITPKEEQLKQRFNLTGGQLLWRRWKMNELKAEKARDGIALTGEQLFKQEYPSTISEAFQSGAGNVFDTEELDKKEAKTPLTKQQAHQLIDGDDSIPESLKQGRKDAFDALWLLGVNFWVLPQVNHKYVLGADPSDGEGADSSSCDIWDKDTVEQCAQLYRKIRPDEFAEAITLLCQFYSNAFAGVENNMLTTVLFLSKIYDNYYFEVKVDEKTAKKTKKLGWNTNTKTRDLMIDDFIIAFEDGSAKINSAITLAEMKTFVKGENGKREHANGKHDDALFGAFIALQMRRFYREGVRVFANKPAGF